MNLNTTTESGDINESRKEKEVGDLIAELCLNISHDSVKFCLRNYQYGKNLP